MVSTADEDFFDKLVDDAYTPIKANASSDDARAFADGNDPDDANLFVADSALNEAGLRNDVANEDASSSSVEAVQCDANKLRDDDVMRSEVVDDVVRLEVVDDMALSVSNIIDGSGSPGVKQVDWGSFYADSSVDDGRGFGSYSDFFTDLDGTAEVDLVSNDTNNSSVGLDNDSASGQNVDNSHSWENLYPGWKYDASTGQWYQVDGHDANVNSQESYINSTSSQDNSDVAYLKQSTTSAVAGTAESVSTWN